MNVWKCGLSEHVSEHDLTREVLERDYLTSDEVTQATAA